MLRTKAQALPTVLGPTHLTFSPPTPSPLLTMVPWTCQACYQKGALTTFSRLEMQITPCSLHPEGHLICEDGLGQTLVRLLSLGHYG